MTKSNETKKSKKSPRQLAREYALQSLYQWQLSGMASEELMLQFETQHDFKGVDKEYWRELVSKGIGDSEDLRLKMKPYLNRSIKSINPVELSILQIAFYEFVHRPEIPFRVVINEAIDLAKSYGAADSHRFINGLLDAAAKDLRKTEVAMQKKE